MPVPVFWSREYVKALIVVWKDEKIQEQIGSGKKRNTHVHRRIFLSIFLPQLTTNLERTPKLCGQEHRLPIAIVIRIRIPIKMTLPCKRNSRSGSRSGSTYPENVVPCKRSDKSHAAMRGFVVETMTSQADRMCFVSVNGNNIFKDNHVKLRVVTFVYVYFINMKKKNDIEIFVLRTSLNTPIATTYNFT